MYVTSVLRHHHNIYAFKLSLLVCSQMQCNLDSPVTVNITVVQLKAVTPLAMTLYMHVILCNSCYLSSLLFT